jgi:hypothetical protein
MRRHDRNARFSENPRPNAPVSCVTVHDTQEVVNGDIIIEYTSNAHLSTDTSGNGKESSFSPDIPREKFLKLSMPISSLSIHQMPIYPLILVGMGRNHHFHQMFSLLIREDLHLQLGFPMQTFIML